MDPRKVLKNFQCSFCSETVKEPVVLYCKHLICLNHIPTKVKSYTCPKCKARTPIKSPLEPVGYIASAMKYIAFEADRQNQDTMNKLGLELSDNSDTEEDPCQHTSQKSPSSCSHCDFKFCESCWELHRAKIRKDIIVNFKKCHSDQTGDEAMEKAEASILSNSNLVKANLFSLFEERLKILKTIMNRCREAICRRYDVQIAKKCHNARSIREQFKEEDIRITMKYECLLSESIQYSDSELLEIFRTIKQLMVIQEQMKAFVKESEAKYYIPGSIELEVKLMKLIVDSIPEIRSVNDLDGEIEIELLPLLHKSVAEGNRVEIERLVLRFKKEFWPYDVRQRIIDHKDNNDHGRTMLHQAVIGSHFGAVKFLITECQADTSIVDDEELCAVHYAAGQGNLELFDFILEASSYVMTSQENERTLKNLVVRIFSNENQSFLHHFIAAGGKALEQMKAFDGGGLMHAAISCDNFESLKVLLKGNFDASLKDNFGNTALHCAAFKGFKPMFDFILTERPELEEFRNKDGKTAVECFQNDQ